MSAKVVAVLALVVAASCGAMEREMNNDTSGDMKLMNPEQSYVDSTEEPVTTRRPLTTTTIKHVIKPKWMQTMTVFEPYGQYGYVGRTKRSTNDEGRSRLLRWKLKNGKAVHGIPKIH